MIDYFGNYLLIIIALFESRIVGFWISNDRQNDGIMVYEGKKQ